MVHNFILCDLISPSCLAAADRVASDVRAALTTPSEDSPTDTPPAGRTSPTGPQSTVDSDVLVIELVDALTVLGAGK
jgi:hypothetical protein